MTDAHIDASELKEAAARLKAVGDRELRLALLRGVRKGAEPAKNAARAGAAALPSRGGLSARVASSRFSVAVRTGGKHPGVTVKATNGYDIASMNRGRLRHRVFGRNVWVNQAVTPGWFDKSIEATAPVVRAAVIDEVRHIQRLLDN